MIRMLRSAWLLCALTIVFACSEASGPGSGPGDPDPEPPLPVSAALVSPSVARPGGVAGSAIMAGEAFVSMRPETDVNGYKAEIRNLRTEAVVTAPMFNGGFDPIAVQAEAQDTLAVRVIQRNGHATTTYALVPIKSKPKVVRTSPPNRKTDVPLNPVIVVVFDQPMDSSSLTQAILLKRGGVELAGTVSGEANGGVVLRSNFAPAAPLEPLTTYQLSVTTAALSLDGEPLEQDVTFEFTTADTGSAGGVVRFRIINAASAAGDVDVLLDGNEIASNIPYMGSSGYLEIPAGYHELWYQADPGTMDESRGTLTPGDYTALPCCVLFPQGGWVIQDDNRAPAAGFARIRIVTVAPLSSPMQVYLTAPGADTTGVQPIPVDENLWVSEYVEVPAGEYQLRATAWDGSAIDSGPITLLEGQVRTVVSTGDMRFDVPYRFMVVSDRNQ